MVFQDLTPNDSGVPPPATESPAQRKPDIALARRALLWEPKVPLEEGLQKALEYFRERA
jgi:UDP-glucuronate decarboxylase